MTLSTTARLTLKVHLFEIGAMALVTVLLSLAAIGVAWWLWSQHVSWDCVTNPDLRWTQDCLGTPEALSVNEDGAGRIMVAMAAFPFLAGCLLGVPLVASEIEDGTAVTVWWMGTSRRQWLLERLAVVGLALALALTIAAASATFLEAQRLPRYDLATIVPRDYGSWGPLLVLRGLAVFAASVTIGLLVGRILPALVLAGLVAVFAYIALGLASTSGWPAPEYYQPRTGAYAIELVPPPGTPAEYMDREGNRLRFDQILSMAPFPLQDPRFDTWFSERFGLLRFGVPGQTLQFVMYREMTILALTTVGLVGLSAVMIDRRRPQ